MPCVQIRHLKLHVSQKFSTYFSLGGMNVMFLLLVNRFEKFFDRQMQNYLDKFKIVNWNSFDVTCIDFTGPFVHYPRRLAKPIRMFIVLNVHDCYL